MIDRDYLEELALANCSAIDYYDLADNMAEVTDEELRMLAGIE